MQSTEVQALRDFALENLQNSEFSELERSIFRSLVSATNRADILSKRHLEEKSDFVFGQLVELYQTLRMLEAKVLSIKTSRLHKGE